MSDSLADPKSFNHSTAVNNINSGPGQQTNLIQDGSNNWQVNAHTANVTVCQVAAPAEIPPTPSSTALPRHDSHFIDRTALFEQIQDRASTPGNWLALVGLGGVGKTQLATKYVKSIREKDKNVWILWIFASHAVRFDESVRDIADTLKLPNRDNPQVNVLQLLQTWLAESTRRWLIVLDNADDTAYLDQAPPTADTARATKPRIEYLKHSDHGTVILTSRSRDEALKFVSEDNIIEVKEMDAEHARQLLKCRLSSAYDETGAEALAAALDYMPLALSQAASFIVQKKRTYSIARYMTELEESRESRTNLLRQQGTMPKRDRDASNSIVSTWQISFDHVYRDRKSAANLLALMSFCDRQSIPEFLLLGKQQIDDSRSKEIKTLFNEDIQMLEDFSFISTVKDSKDDFEMHRLVQDATQWWLLNKDDKDEFINVQQDFISHLHAVMPSGQYGTWDICRALMPHVESALQLTLTQDSTRLELATIAFKAAWYQGVSGRLDDADKIAQICLQSRVEILGDDHKQTLEVKNGIASLRVLQGRFQEAENLAASVQQTHRKDSDSDDAVTLESMHNLATTYCRQSRLEEAEALAREVLEKRTRLFTEQNFDTTSTMNLLALIYFNQERLEEAKALQQKSYDISVKILGKESPETLVQLHNLAITTYKMKHLEKAEKLQEESLRSTVKVLGQDHPQTLLNLGNLAVIIRDLGRTEEAAAMHMLVLEKRRKVLCDDHPDTLTSMSHVALYNFHSKQWSEAAAMQEKVLESRRRVLGLQHPETQRSVEQLARSLICQLRSVHRKDVDGADNQNQDSGDQATENDKIDLQKTLTLMYDGRGLATKVSKQGVRMLVDDIKATDHTDGIATKIEKLTISSTEPDLLSKVESLEMEIRKNEQDIPANMLQIMSLRTMAVAMLLSRSRNHEWIAKFAEPAIDALRRVLEEGHSDTMTCIGALTYLYEREGEHEKACDQLELIKEINERVLAVQDQTTISEATLAWHRTYRARLDERISKAATPDQTWCSIQ
ncbi:hypothetical protein MRB53_037714 [Persea americana]|nr:hypothetical protein MRB53_037714 [Persea americana]